MRLIPSRPNYRNLTHLPFFNMDKAEVLKIFHDELSDEVGHEIGDDGRETKIADLKMLDNKLEPPEWVNIKIYRFYSVDVPEIYRLKIHISCAGEPADLYDFIDIDGDEVAVTQDKFWYYEKIIYALLDEFLEPDEYLDD